MSSSKPSSLPHEIYLSIFSHLSIPDLLSASQVNQNWHKSSLSILYANLHINSKTQLSIFHKYSLLQRHNGLIRSITLCRINLDVQDKLTLSNECKDLISIKLIKCSNLTAEFLKDLARSNAKSLEKLYFTECFSLSAFGIAELFSPSSQHLPKFHTLILQYNPEYELDLEFFEFMANNFKSQVFKIIILNSKRFDSKNRKILQTFARVSKDLDVLETKKDNIQAIKREREMTDDEILRMIED
ncbi:7008_t:CDS:2 [Diversispora eburnea]|uniref:7008_t:CDS:1 n=1 Tax=Diversispora eburnea TaxID=1213867 RepID=A0A9N8UZB0_9GLOM|nr:7008_t:CDS:2 [Diversispora eburnea]